MATTKAAGNVLQKLAQARLLFLKENVQKSGKNIKLEFKYFELSDIIPSAIQIFAEVGLVTNTVFDGEKAVMTVYNTDNLEERGLEFIAPYREVGQILNREGKEVTNPMQALGSSITYLRRYLWMMVLDIVEHDDIDENNALPTEKPKESHKPATPEQRKEIKEQLTAPKAEETNSNASEEQINKLKAACKALLNKDGDQEEFINQIAMMTDGFTVIDSTKCDELVAKLEEVMQQYS